MTGSVAREDNGARGRNTAFKGYKDGSVDFYGDQVEMITGYSKDVFNTKKMKWIELVHEDDREGVKSSFVKALKGDKTYDREYRVLAKNGEVVWIQEWSQIVLDEGGEVDYVTGILLDITEEKKLEEARLKAEKLTGKYLTFNLDGEDFGIGILKTKEIIGMMPITSVPQTPGYVKGVINLRGRVIPVIDLRLKFGMDEAQYNDRTCIIVVEVSSKVGTVQFGIVVDSVSDVVNINGQDIEETPELGRSLDRECILGMAKLNGGVNILLNIDEVITDRDMELIANQG